MRQAITNLAKESTDGRKRGTHPGLILQRYLVWQSDPGKRQSDPGERRTLLDAARDAARSQSLHAVYCKAFKRWQHSFSLSDKPFCEKRLATTGRLIVGLGADNVLETGLRLHHTYGVPIIPGSALKGLAAHYGHEIWGQRHDTSAPGENTAFRRSGKYHALLFGSTGDGGIVTFHDAWITPDSLKARDADETDALCLDVMTPHHPKWQTNQAPPSDFDSPVPVSFLSVSGRFDVRLSWAGPAGTPHDRARGWTTLAMQLLQEALAGWGVGGKTSSGYGRLVAGDVPRKPLRPSPATPARPNALPKPRDKVEAQLLEERTRKGSWRAMHVASELKGHIHNSHAVPADKNAGDVLELIVASASERGMDFRYPTPADEARAQRAADKGKGRRGRKQRR